jgi:GNAT superfamily N-acetyltransferase
MAGVEFRRHDGEAARALLDELSEVFVEVYAEPPYYSGEEDLRIFQKRFAGQTRQQGFSLVTARSDGTLVGFIFGYTLSPTTQWWSDPLTPVAPSITQERPGRTFAVIEMVVRSPWRRRGVGRGMHDLLLKDRREERATLTVLPAAEAAQAAYARWGWHKVTQTINPLPGDPVYDLLLKPLS